MNARYKRDKSSFKKENRSSYFEPSWDARFYLSACIDLKLEDSFNVMIARELIVEPDLILLMNQPMH